MHLSTSHPKTSEPRHEPSSQFPSWAKCVSLTPVPPSLQAIGVHLAKVKALAGGAEVKDLPQGVTWFNLSRPLSLSHDLRGKLSVLEYVARY